MIVIEPDKDVEPDRIFFKEMINYNVAHDRMPIDLSIVPKKILEQVCHNSIMSSVLKERPSDFNVMIGPDAQYHHVINGISVKSPQGTNLFMEHKDGNWYVFYLCGPNIVVMRLDDTEWTVLDPLQDEDQDVFQEILQKAFAHLGMIPNQAMMGFDMDT